MLILYEFAISPFAQKTKIALREKGIEFEARNVFAPGHADDFRRGNPRRELPFLVEDDLRVNDSTVILDYLEERWPDPPLMPTDPADRAAIRLIEELADTRLEALNFCISEVMTFPVDEAATAEAVVAASRSEIARLHAGLTTRLGGAAYFGGSAPNRADVSLWPHVNASRAMRNGPYKGPLAEWARRMRARPSVASTVGEIKPVLDEFKQLMGQAQRAETTRLLRDHRLDWLVQAGGAPILMKRLAAGNVRFSDT